MHKRQTYRRGHLVEPIIALQASGVRLAEVVATVVPRRNARRWAGTLHKQRTGLTTLRKFVELYKNYTRTELVFDDAHTRALLAELGERAPISFDVASVNWPTYFTDHHLPELVKLTSDYSAKKKADRARRAGVEDLEVTPTAAAVFDLDGTVSVSYTHLDVYKRQVPHGTGFPGSGDHRRAARSPRHRRDRRNGPGGVHLSLIHI